MRCYSVFDKASSENYIFIQLMPVRRNNRSEAAARVLVNVYDLVETNNRLYFIGLGIFHSGVQVGDIGTVGIVPVSEML